MFDSIISFQLPPNTERPIYRVDDPNYEKDNGKRANLVNEDLLCRRERGVSRKSRIGNRPASWP